MGCNCKRAATLEEDYGLPTEESGFEKVVRIIYKILIFILIICLVIVVSPVVMVIAVYQIIFGKGGIRLPHKIFEFAGKQ